MQYWMRFLTPSSYWKLQFPTCRMRATTLNMQDYWSYSKRPPQIPIFAHCILEVPGCKVEIKQRSLTHGTDYVALRESNERKILKIYSMLVKSTKEKNKEREVSEQHRPFLLQHSFPALPLEFCSLRHESETRGQPGPLCPMGHYQGLSEASSQQAQAPNSLQLSLKITFKLPTLPGFSNFAQRL